MTKVQEELTYLNLVADLESEAETPCESRHTLSTCSQKVVWRVKPPCACSATLVCQNARVRWGADSIICGYFKCTSCNKYRLMAEDFIWRAV